MLDIRELACELLSAQEQGTALRPPSERDPRFDLDAGYAVAAELDRLRRLRGWTPVGRKIGFTNQAIWPELGLATPIWGYLYDRTVRYAARATSLVSLMHRVAPKIEPEMVFRLRAPLPPGGKEPARILTAVEWIALGFEIVDCHYPGWRMRCADAVADFGVHALLIIGAPRSVEGVSADQLCDVQVSLSRNGEKLTEGTGKDVLGSPALALAYFDEVLAGQGQSLAAGEVITTATLTAALPIGAGESWQAQAKGLELGSLAAVFS